MYEINETLEEIKAKYTLEPYLKDIYVEASSDQAILKWFFNSLGFYDVQVFCIDLVNIPETIFVKYNLRLNSNQSLVIALSEELSIIPKHMAKCLADADFDRYLKLLRKNSVLKYTDYTSMEMYFLNNDHIKKFSILELGYKLTLESKLLRNILATLKCLFVYRLANLSLGWKLVWINKIDDYIEVKKDGVIFNSSKFLDNYLLPRKKHKEIFLKKVKEISDNLDTDIRNNIRGHDFTDMLYKVSHRIKGMKRFRHFDDFEKALIGPIELSFIESEPLFVDLKKWGGTAVARS
jgi:hypothetical protein